MSNSYLENIIISSNDIVLIDSSIIQKGGPVLELEYVEELIEFLEIPNSWTVKEAAADIQQYLAHTSEKLKDSSDTKKMLESRGMKYAGEESKTALEKLNNQIYKLLQLAHQKELAKNPELSFNDLNYNILFDITETLCDKLGLIKDTGYYHINNKIIPRKHDICKNLAASLYYLSLFSNKNPVLISCNANFVSVLGVTSQLMGAENLLPDNKYFREKLRKNPLKFYLVHKDGYELRLDSSKKEDIEYNQHFWIYGGRATPNEQKTIKEQIKDSWKRFSSLLSNQAKIENQKKCQT